MFNGMYSLEKLVLGENFRFDGNGNVAENKYAKLPAPVGGGMWYHAETGEEYPASEIPDKTAATYVAVNPQG